TPRRFEAEVLRVLLQIHAAEQAAEADAPEPRPLPSADDRAREGQFWRRVGRLIVGEDSLAGGLSLGGFGAIRIPAEVSETSLTAEVEEAFRRLSRNGARRVLLHINNLENLTAQDARAAAVLMQQVRDTLLTDYAHWVFVGATGIEQTVFGATPQVASIIPLSVPLPPLTSSEVADLLSRRYVHLKSGIRFTPPVEPVVAGALYERFRGDLRGFLNLLARAVQLHASSAPGETVSAEEIIALTAPLYRAAVVPNLVSPDDYAHLARVAGGQPWTTEFRVTDLESPAPARFTQSAASKLVRRLITSGVIREGRRVVRSVYYHVADGRVSVALEQT
ncbi:MAG: hypothetical protein Q7U75_12840, partial [Desulfobacterales bacterium]|nr:hypothetical protein [Desulfobacterales bacterium]